MNVVERIVKEGTDAHVTFNETLRVLRSPVVGEEISTPSIFTGYKTSELGVTGALGDYTRWDADSGRIRVATGDVPPDEILPTLIHEFGHHFFSEITRINVLARGASMFDRNDFYGNLAYAFPLDRQADFQLMFGKHIITKEEFNKLARIRVTDMYPLFTPLEEAASKAFGVPIKVSKNPDMMNSLIFAAPDGITIKPKDVQKVFREILRDHKSGQMLRNSYKGIRYEIARDAGQEVAISMSPGTAAEIPTFSEIVEMTIEATAKKIARQRNPRGSPSWIRALQRVILDDKYYLKDSELAARVMELMWRDMAVAKEVGPNVTKMFSKAILDVSPKLAIVLKGQTIEAVNAILHDKVIVGQVEVLRTIDEFKSTFGLLTAEQKHQFSRWGVHAWQSGYYDGKTVLAGDEFWIHAGEPYMKAIIPTTGEINNIPISKFRPSYATSFTKSKEGATRVARRIKNGELEYIPFRIEEADGEHATLMILPIDQASVHYVEGYEGLVDWLATNNPELRDVVVPHGIATQIAMNALKRLGEDHVMLFNDNGAYKIISGNPIRADLTTDTPFQTMLTRTRGPVGSFDSINGKSGEHIINLDNRTIAEALLRQEFHVNERDLPYVIDEVVDALKRSDLIGIDPRMFGLEHPLSRAVPTSQPKWSVENAGYDSYYHLTRLERQANQVGAKIDRTLDGRYRVEVDSNEAPREAGVFIEPEEVEEFLYRARQKAEDFGGRSRRSQETGSYEHLGDADNIGRTGTPGEPPPPGGGGFGGNRGGRPNSGGTGGFNGGGSRGPRFNETFEGNTPPPGPGWISRIRDATMFFGSFFTAMENSAKVIERNFGLPAYTRIFQPLQEAIRTVDREMMAKRPGKDWSFHSKLKDIEKLTWKLNKEQREHVIRWLEAMSREEIIRPGGLSQRGMRPAEIKMADELRRLGLQHELPQLLSQWRAMRNLVDGRKKFLRTYKQMAQVKLPPELRARIEELYKLSNLRKSEWTLDELGARLNLNEGEKAVIELLEATSKWPKDRFSIFLVGRLAAADPLPRGFKSMRDVIAARYKMNPTQIQLGKEMEALFNESFKASGIDPKRYLGGYYPHMRQYIEKSIMPDAPWIQDLLPKETRFTANKFRTGELDPYTMEPLKVAYKHVRGMLMHEHFDKHLPDVRTVLSMLKRTDSRAFRIMNEYVHELQGRPHASFTRLQEIIEGTAEILGTKVDRELSSQIVNSIAALTYQATIPFRAALIARNYFQMVQMIVPRVGMSDFIEGLKIALTKEGFQQAKRANAVTENVAPIISQEAIFDFTNLKLSRRMQRLTEVGFRWYQKADDLGRATAFHAQRVRINRGLSKLNKGMYGNPRDPKSFMRFLEDSKVTTFDALDQEQFVKLMRAGNTEGAKSYLGEMLARETIFRYGHANHPAGWGSVGGRLFGQFGTWPVQYKDYLLTGLTRGTKKDKIEFLLWHSGINAAIVAGGAKLGYDLNSWVSYPSLQYTGGPWADIAIDFVKLLGGSDMEQAMALQSLKFQFVPTLNDPRSIILPTSYAINDLTRLLEGGGRVDEALGFRRIEPDANSSALLTF